MGIYTSLCLVHADPVGAALAGTPDRAIEREAAIKPASSVCQADLGLRFYDGFAAVRGGPALR